jgi:acyl-coenzyme A thioesterase PaaI-like protein
MAEDGNDTTPECARRRVRTTQNVSRMCLVCGVENAFGLHGRFYVLESAQPKTAPRDAGAPAVARDDGTGMPEILGIFTPRDDHQSYPGRLHGGIAAAALDETIGRAIIVEHPDTWGVTVELTLRYRKPLPLDRELRVLGRITRDGSRLFEGTGEIVLDDGSVAVEARGKYLKMGIEAITAEGMGGRDWFADPRRAPEWIDVAATSTEGKAE